MLLASSSLNRELAIELAVRKLHREAEPGP
jgi:hypothetical protein